MENPIHVADLKEVISQSSDLNKVREIALELCEAVETLVKAIQKSKSADDDQTFEIFEEALAVFKDPDVYIMCHVADCAKLAEFDTDDGDYLCAQHYLEP